MSKKVQFSDILDFSNDTEVRAAIKTLENLLKVYDSLVKKSTTGVNQIKRNQSELVKSLNAVATATKQLDETKKKDQKIIAETNEQTKALTATYTAQKKQIVTLEAQIKKLTKEKALIASKTKQANNTNKEAIRLEGQLANLTGKNAKETAALRLQIQEKRKALSAEAKEAAGRVTLYQKESARLNDLRIKYKNVALAQGQNSRAAKKLRNEITPLDKKLKGLDASVGQNQRSVGAYGDAISQTVPAVGALRTQVTTLFRLFLTNPIGILVTTVVALVAAFAKTQKGADTLNNVMGQLGATVDVVVGRVAELAEGIIDFISGTEGGLDRIKNSFKDIGEEIAGAVSDAAILNRTQIELRKVNIEVTRDTAERSRLIQDQIIITRDLTRSAQAQRNALREANKLELENQNDFVRLAEKKLDLARQEFAFTPENLRTDEQRLSIVEAQAGVEGAIAASTAKQREILNRVNELEVRILANIKRQRTEREKGRIDLTELEAKAGIERIKIDDEVTNALVANSKRIGEETKKRLEEQVEAERDANNKRDLLRQTSFETASIIGNQIFENGRINRENELIDLQRQKEFELELAGDNAQKRAQIEKTFAQKEKQLRIQQAQASKKQALFNIGLNTAEAITKTVANLGFPFATPFVIAASVLGAAQAAAVISQPLPAFEKGGIAPGGDIITSEKGREMAVTPDGKLIMTSNKGAEVRSDIPKGSAILNNPITEKLLKGGFDHASINNDATLKINQVLQEQRDRSTQRLISTMQKENDILIASLGKKIEKIPTDVFNVTDGDLKKVSVKGNEKRIWWGSKNSM